MLFPNAMLHAYTEDQLVEQPAIGLFAELGRQTVSALEETFGRQIQNLRRKLVQPLPHLLSRRVNPGEDNG
jgi:hypothetical protein